MDTEKAIRSRHSVRAFLPKPVDPALLDKILDLANQAPSGCNIQPFRLAVADGELWERMSEELVECARNQRYANEIPWSLNYPERYKERQRRAGHGLYKALGIQREDRVGRERQFLKNFRAFGAPGVVFVFTDASVGEYATLDLGIWMQTFMLAAHANGVATVAQTSLASYPQVVRKYFDVPGDLALVCAISYGYADESETVNKFRPGRASLAELMLQPKSADLPMEEPMVAYAAEPAAM